jgi:cyclophilin family peptidyl-prolyl cis-trans isomerase/HEAT repeat protein
MSPKHLLQFYSAVFFLVGFSSCSAPTSNVQNDKEPYISKYSDPVIREIHELKNDRNTRDLAYFLTHQNPQYRAEAAMAFGSIQDSAVVKDLVLCLQDEEPLVRMMSAFALGQLRISSVSADLVELIVQDTTTTVRTEALEALGKAGGAAAADFLLNYAPNFFYDEGGKAWGIYHLGLQKMATQEHAMQMAFLLDSDYEETRLAAAHFFSRYVVKQPFEGLDKLVPIAANDPSAEVRMAAARALGNFDFIDRAEVLSDLILFDPDPGVRVNAVLALQKGGILEVSERVFQALDDGNPNVALAAAGYFKSHATIADINKLSQKALVHPNGQVQAAIYAAVVAHSQIKLEPIATVKQLISNTINPYDQAALIRALEFEETTRPFLDSVIFSGNKVTSTVALETLHAQLQRFGAEDNFKLQLASQLLNQDDSGLLAYTGVMLRDEQMSYKAIFERHDLILEQLNKRHIPEELEAWIELNSALSYLSGEAKKPMPELIYHSINWEALERLGAEPTVSINTPNGTFDLLLLPDDAPATVSYILDLLENTFYDEKSFHRVVPNFVVQAGCPRGDGFGSTSPLLRSEFSPIHYGAGVAGIASAGKDTESCQWFVTHSTTPHLDGRYTIFGVVTQGMDVVQQLCVGDKILRMDISAIN